MRKVERTIGGIPESKILQLYLGDLFEQFEQIWVAAWSPSSQSYIKQIRFENRVGRSLVHVAYSKTGNCVMIIKKGRRSSAIDGFVTFACHFSPTYGIGFEYLKRILVPLEEPDGTSRAQKIIKEFIAEIRQNN